jgi:hypothetical protein
VNTVKQCFVCQKYGHDRHTCRETHSTCLRCGQSHRLNECQTPKENSKCANCSGSHIFSYRGCSAYKPVVKAATQQKTNTNSSNTYAKAALPIVNPQSANTQNVFQDPLVALLVIAECLGAMAHFIDDMDKGKETPDSMAPFTIVSDVARRYLHMEIPPSSFLCRSISSSPLKERLNVYQGNASTTSNPSTSISLT